MNNQRMTWAKVANAVGALGVACLPLWIWLVWLFLNGQIQNLLKKPEISFISLILAAEAMQTAYRNRGAAQPNSGSDIEIMNFWTIGLILCAIFLALDIAQYEGQVTNASSASLIIALKIPVLLLAAFAFLWSRMQLTSLETHGGARNKQVSKSVKYDTKHSRQFYSETALAYDSRNSAELRQIQLEIVHCIRSIRDRRSGSSFNVLDLGSGTGRLIAEHFYSQGNVSWTAVDNCPEMLSQFKKNFERARVTLQCLDGDLLDEQFLRDAIDGKKYDAIVMCYTLSSIQHNPNWKMLLDMLNRDGEIVIAEADKSFISSVPTFDILVDDVEYQLELRSVDALQLKTELESEGLAVQIMPTLRAEKRYGYVLRGKLGCEPTA